MPASSTSKKHRRPPSIKEGFSVRNVEELFSRQFMRLAGILFLGASLWFAANSADTLFKIARNLVSPVELITEKPGPSTQGTGESIVTQEGTPSPDTGIVILIMAGIAAGWTVLQLLTIRRRRAEFQVISVFLTFISLLLVMRKYGWNPELTFSLLIMMAAGLFFFGKHLSHTGTRLHFLFTWGIFCLWWLLRIMISADREKLPTFFIFSSLLFLAYHIIQLMHGFAGQRKLSHHYELGAILLNPLLFLLLVSTTILKFYGKTHVFFLVLALAALYVVSLLAMEQFRKQFRKTPFLIVTLGLISLLLPLLFWKDQVILLSGGLSVLLLIYSAQTKDQPSILVSIGLASVMVLVFVKEMLFVFGPAAILGDMAGNSALFYKGLIAGLFVPAVAFANRRLLKNLDIRFSRKWFSRRRYRTLLKGVFLGGLYFGLFWIWQRMCFMLWECESVALLSWFSFHCLFSVAVIPWQWNRRSSLLPVIIIVSVILTGIYPSLLSMQNLRLLDLMIRDVPPGPALFMFHYIPAGLFLLFIAVVLQYAPLAFKRSKDTSKNQLLIYTSDC